MGTFLWGGVREGRGRGEVGWIAVKNCHYIELKCSIGGLGRSKSPNLVDLTKFNGPHFQQVSTNSIKYSNHKRRIGDLVGPKNWPLAPGQFGHPIGIGRHQKNWAIGCQSWQKQNGRLPAMDKQKHFLELKIIFKKNLQINSNSWMRPNNSSTWCKMM